MASRDWEVKQERVFTKWVGYHLGKRGIPFDDLKTGFSDGVNLINLYEQISGESLGKYNKAPKMRVHKIANLNSVVPKVNQFVESVGIKTQYSAEQITDGDLKSILGMTWVLIHKFSIQEVSEEELSAREGLLLWCQKVVKDYGLQIDNFYSSWEDGRAFCAIINKFKPDLLDYSKCSDKNNKVYNLTTAIDVASDKLGIPRLLEPSDFDEVSKSDEKSIMTYVAYYWRTFASSKKNEIAAARVAKLASRQKANDQLANDYEENAQKLVKWIEESTAKYNTKKFGNSLAKVQAQASDFSNYKTGEKVDKTREKSELENALSQLITKQKAENSPVYVPQISPEHINSLWDNLGNVEDQYDVDLREALRRQKYLDMLLKRFRSKVAQLDKWCNDKNAFLSSPTETNSVSEAQAALRALDSYDNEYNAHGPSFDQTSAIGKEIIDAEHEEAPSCVAALEALARRREELEALSRKRRELLELDLLYQIYRENLATVNSFIEEKTAFLSADVVIDSVSAAQSQLKNLEAYGYEYTANAVSFSNTFESGQRCIDANHPKSEEVKQSSEKLAADRAALEELAAARKATFEAELDYQKFLVQVADLRSYIAEKVAYLDSEVAGESVHAANAKQREFDAYRIDYSVKKSSFDDAQALGEKLVAAAHPQHESVQQILAELASGKADLEQRAAARAARIQSELDYQNLRVKVADIEAFVAEKEAFLTADIAANSVVAVQGKIRALEAYNQEYSAFERHFTAATELAQKLVADAYQAEYAQGVIDSLAASRARLEQAAADRSAKLAEELRLQTLIHAFRDDAEDLTQWYNQKKKLLNAPFQSDSINATQQRVRALDAYDSEYAAVSKTFEAAAATGQQIIEAGHSEAAKVQEDINRLAQYRAELEADSAARRAALEKDLEERRALDKKMLEYAKRAEELFSFTDDALALLNEAVLASSVAEVEKLEQESAEFANAYTAKRSDADAVIALGSEIGTAAVNPYTTATAEGINQAFDEVKNAHESRQATLAQEKEKQLRNQTMLQDYAAKAAAFQEYLAAAKANLDADAGSATLEQQLEQLKTKSAEIANEGQTRLNVVIESNNELANAGVAEDSSTPVGQLQVQFDQLKELAKRKIQTLEERIIVEKSGDITPEQLAEYRATFQHFDRDKDGFLNRHELKACLSALSIDLTDHELDATIAKYNAAGDGKVLLEEFVAYMQSQTKATDSYEDVLDSFSTLAGGKEYITLGDLTAAMSREQAEYLVSKMPKSSLSPENGYDYKAYVNQSFSKTH